MTNTTTNDTTHAQAVGRAAADRHLAAARARGTLPDACFAPEVVGHVRALYHRDGEELPPSTYAAVHAARCVDLGLVTAGAAVEAFIAEHGLGADAAAHLRATCGDHSDFGVRTPRATRERMLESLATWRAAEARRTA
jgi:hypothetical protein